MDTQGHGAGANIASGTRQATSPLRPRGAQLAPLMSTREVAEHLNVKPARIYELARRRQIPHLKIGHTLRFRPAEIEAWLDDCARPA